MKDDKLYYSNLIIKYLSEKASVRESQKLQQWLHTSEINKMFFEEAKSSWELSVNHTDKYPHENAWAKVIDKIDKKQERPFLRPRVVSMPALLRVAAVIILILGGVIISYRFTSLSEDSINQVARNTLAGEQRMILLPDGSKVWLNGNSKLRYPEKFGKERNVFLEGEGFFEVTKDANKPFIVQTDVLQVRVLGTSFNVKGYKGDKRQLVTVVEGKVEVSSITSKGEQKQTLLPNDQVDLDKTTYKLTPSKVEEPTQYTQWKQGGLYLNQVSFAEMALALERTFGWSVEYPQIIKDCKVTIFYDKESPIEGLNKLQEQIFVEYTLAGKKLVFAGKGCISPIKSSKKNPIQKKKSIS